MKLTFIFPVDCKVIQNGNNITVITAKEEVTAPITLESSKDELNRSYYVQAKEVPKPGSKNELRMHIG